MRPFLILFCFISIAASAQRSVVFLPQPATSHEEARRPKPRIRPIDKHFVQKPQAVGTSNSDFPNINVSQWLLADQNETSIAINPTDPQNLIVGANDYRTLNTLWYFTSTDGGFTWKSGELPTNQALYYATDPSVAFGPDGVAFFANGRLEAAGSPYPINDVVAYKSTNKGASWDSEVRVFFDSLGSQSAGKLADKYYLAVAPTSVGPLPPRVYVAWAEYSAGKSRIVISRSGDGGATWSTPVPISAYGKFQAPVPAVAVGGEVYVTYIDLDTNSRDILFAKSTDGGATFSAPKRIATYNNLGLMYPEDDPNPHPIIKGHLRVNSFPSIAIDHSFRHFNRIYTTWAGKGNDGRHHIYLSKSDDFGNTWSEALPIENDKSAINTDKFFPWIAVDPTTGIVGICFYDSRLDAPANQMTDLFLGLSEDGGTSFTVQRISDQSFNPSVALSTDSLLGNGDTLAFFGDYNGLTAFNGMWYPAWTDSRTGYDQDIYVGIVNPVRPEAVRNLEVQELNDHTPRLSWTHNALTVYGAPLGSYVFRIKRSDGASIDLPSTERSFRDSSVAPATSYTYEVTAVAGDVASVVQEVLFTPSAIRKPTAPVVLFSRAEVNGFLVSFRIPERNVVGDTIRNLVYLYYIIDDIVVDSFPLTDDLRGKEFERSFTTQQGHHKFQLSATTFTNGEFASSDRSEAVWLYSGMPKDSYTESFQQDPDVFSIFAWDTTSIDLPSVFVNDSLPNVPYTSTNSWFVLPPVRISESIHTLEFDHIALVALQDSAVVELSLDNGVSYHQVDRYTKASEPVNWGATLAGSIPASDSIPLKWHVGKDAMIRFRLGGINLSQEDGWFIDNIRFTNKLDVKNHGPQTTQPILVFTEKDEISFELNIPFSGHVFLIYSDVLGRTVEQVLDGRYLPVGKYRVNTERPAAGAYVITALVKAPGSRQAILRGKFILRPD